jgi:hypothetical protein
MKTLLPNTTLIVMLCSIPSVAYAQLEECQCEPAVSALRQQVAVDTLFDESATIESIMASDVFDEAKFIRPVQYANGGQSAGRGNGSSPDPDDRYDSRTGGGTGMHTHHPADVHKTNKQAHPHSGGVDPTDPTAILTQIQFQNNFAVESYNASGYANTFIVQPVLPFPVAMPGLKEFFPAHIMRPTLPFPAPTADPDGPLGVQGGMGDFTILDVGVHPTSWGNLALGYSLIAPTSTHPQLGLQEWQLGPTVGLVYKKIPKTILGFVAQMPFSLESEASSIDVQLTYVRHLPNQTYIRWGDTFWTFNTDTGAYNMPIEIAFGKVFKKGLGGLPNNVFVMPFYTPEEMHSGPGGDKWGVKLNVTLLFPEKKFDPLLGFLWGESSRRRRHRSCD